MNAQFSHTVSVQHLWFITYLPCVMLLFHNVDSFLKEYASILHTIISCLLCCMCVGSGFDRQRENKMSSELSLNVSRIMGITIGHGKH